MNKRIDLLHSGRKYWPIMFMAILFFCGSCATTHRDKLLEEAVEAGVLSEDLESQFTAERLSADELAAFESRAQQKLQDFSDYLQLLGDSSLDSVFRQQAIRQALALFVDAHTQVWLGEEKEHLIDFLNRFGEGQPEISQYEIQEINVTRPLQPTTDRQYAGILSFQQYFSAENRPAISRQAQFLVRKVPKRFGDQEEWVWEVLLAGIE